MILTVELVPKTCWFSNVRSAVTKGQWDKIKQAVSSKVYDLCEICGGSGSKHPVECHEIWSYDDKTLIQKLEGMIALCPSCHQVKHFGFAEMRGKGPQALAHLMKINKISKLDAENYLKEVFDIWSKRSKKNWTLDISFLKNEYSIDVEKIKKQKA